MLDDFGGLVLPANSRAQRDIPAASKGHCSAHAVLGRGEGVHTQAESWLELCNLYLLNAMLDVVELREQEIFHYGWDRNDPEVHVFDVVATLANHEKIAYTVKPEDRVNSRPRRRGKNGHRSDQRTFLEKMGEISWWAAVKSQSYKDVRLVTEADIHPIDLRNAQTFAAVRLEDPEADEIAFCVVQSLPVAGGASLRDLTLATGMEARGYRALIRLMRNGVLKAIVHEVIGPKTIVQVRSGI
jgi:hypothetical protein